MLYACNGKSRYSPLDMPSTLSKYVKVICKLLLYLEVVHALWAIFGEGTTSRVFTAGAAAKAVAVNAISACNVRKCDLLQTALFAST